MNFLLILRKNSLARLAIEYFKKMQLANKKLFKGQNSMFEVSGLSNFFKSKIDQSKFS